MNQLQLEASSRDVAKDKLVITIRVDLFPHIWRSFTAKLKRTLHKRQG